MSGSSGIDTVVMTAYDALNAVVGTDTVASQEWAKLSITYPVGISRVVLDRTAGGGGAEFDDLTFGSAPGGVPEPMTGTTFLAGLPLFGFVKRLLR